MYCAGRSPLACDEVVKGLKVSEHKSTMHTMQKPFHFLRLSLCKPFFECAMLLLAEGMFGM